MRSARWFTEDLPWSAIEKKIARRAFDHAYQRKCGEIAAQVKNMAARSSSSSDFGKSTITFPNNE